MNIRKVLEFTPLMVEECYGAEPSLKEILYEYYGDVFCGDELEELVEQYIAALENNFKGN